MKLVLTNLIILLSLLVSAQEKIELTVRGVSEIAKAPTIVKIQYAIESQQESYSGTIEDLTKRVDILIKELVLLKIKKESIKSSTFTINKSYIWNNDRSKRKDGFRGFQNLSVSLDYSVERLLEILNGSTNNEANANISLSFGIDDLTEKEIRKGLIEMAIEDADQKAETIANKSKLELSGIKSINYLSGNNNSQPVYRSYAEARTLSADSSPSINNFEASDLTFSDQIEIIYLLVKKY